MPASCCNRSRAGSAATRSRCCGTCPKSASTPIAFAAGTRPRGVAARVPWIDLGPPHGSLRYELWHRLRRPELRIEADVVHAPSLAVPPVRGRPLVVTVHDIAFRRLPEVTTKRGVSFHTRGLELARRARRAWSSCRRNSPAGELDARRIRTRPHRGRPVRSRSACAPRPGRDRPHRCRASECNAPYVLTVGTVEPRKDLPTIVRRGRTTPADAPRAHARRRRPARLG